MAQLAVVFPFLSTLQGFVFATSSTATGSLTASFGNPADDLQSTISGKNLVSSNTWTLTTTYIALGVPAGSVITGIISGSLDSRCTTFTTGATSTSGSATLNDGGTIVTLSSARNFSATDASFVNSVGVNNTTLSKPASNSITLTINNVLNTGNSSSAVVTLQQDNLNFTIVFQPPLDPYVRLPELRRETALRTRAGAIMPDDDGDEGPFQFWHNAGWEVQSVQPPAWPPRKVGAQIATGPQFENQPPSQVVFEAPWLDLGGQIQSWQPPSSPPRKTAAMFAAGDQTTLPNPTNVQTWYPVGWEVAPHQPQHPPFYRGRYAPYSLQSSGPLFMTANEGAFKSEYQQPPHPRPERAGAMQPLSPIEALFVRWLNIGWDPTLHGLPHPRPERAGLTMLSEDGIEAAFVPPPSPITWALDMLPTLIYRVPKLNTNVDDVVSALASFFPMGWEVQPPQPPHTRSERAAQLQFAFVIDAVLQAWQNDGWEQTAVQPPHPRPERSAVQNVGDAGIQAIAQLFQAYGWEVIPPQPPHPRPERAASIQPQSMVEALFQAWLNAGAEVQPWQPPHPRPEKAGVGRFQLDLENVFQGWQNAGWEIQLPQPPHPRNEKAAMLPWPWNIEAVFQQFFPDGWEAVLHNLPHPRPERAGAIQPSSPIEALLFGFFPYGWPLQEWQPPHFRPELRGSIMRGDDGNLNVFLLAPPFTAWQVDPTLPPQPHLRVEKGGALMPWSFVEAPFQRWVNDGWEPVLHHLPHIRIERAGAIQPLSMVEAVFQFWRNRGWEAVLHDLPHLRRERAGGIMPQSMVEAVFQFWRNRGWEATLHDLPHPKPERAGAFQPISLVDALFRWVNDGWEIQPWQPPHFGRERWAGLARGDDGDLGKFVLTPVVITWAYELPIIQPRYRFNQIIGGDETREPLTLFQPYGWEVPSPQPPHPKPERAAAFEPLSMVEAVFQRWINDGWEAVLHDLPHLKRERAGGVQPLSVVEALFSLWLNAGWEAQPPQPPHTKFERAAAAARGDDGNLGTFFLTPPVITWAYELPQQPPHPRPERSGVLPAATVIDARLQTWINDGWNPTIAQPPHPRPERSALLPWVVNVDALLTQFFPHGWAFDPPIFVRSRSFVGAAIIVPLDFGVAPSAAPTAVNPDYILTDDGRFRLIRDEGRFMVVSDGGRLRLLIKL